MALDRLINTQGTLRRRDLNAARDDYGDVIPTWVTESVLCEVQQRTERELRDGREIVTSFWSAFFRPDVDPTGWDELTVDGVTYSFDGTPWPARNPRTQATSHIEARVRLVE